MLNNQRGDTMKKLHLLLALLAIFTLSSCKNEVPETSKLDEVKASLTIDDTLTTTILPTLVDGVTISWICSDQSAITDTFVTVQKEEAYDVTLTAILSYDGEDTIKQFDVTIAKIDTSTADLAQIVNFLSTYEMFSSYELVRDITLPTLRSGISIVWSTNNDCMDNFGDIVRPAEDGVDCLVTATGIFSYNDAQTTKDFVFTVKKIDSVQTVTYTGYYEGAGGLEGDLLKSFLHDLIDDHTVISYGGLRDALQDSDEDPDNPNNIILIYSGKSVSSTWDSGSTWNREHVWPRSHGDLGDGSNPAESDMHHVRPAHPSVNSSRSNLDFDEGGSLVNHTTDSYKDSNSFEPRDEVKGDVARMIFYMAVRYEGDDSYPDLELNNYVSNGGPYMGKLDILLKWHREDLPDEFEMNRNDVIYSYQGNRNPFIDHPDFVELIWGN